MNEFLYYQEAWYLFIGIGVLFNGLLIWSMRKWPLWLSLTLIAGSIAFTFTPLTATPDGNTLAPALVVAIFELEASINAGEGAQGLSRGFNRILMVWAVLAAAFLVTLVTISQIRKHSADPIS